ncbi:MAG: hypothetical protein ACTSW1_07785 [Candidatus Hodarchaeales archaeon]
MKETPCKECLVFPFCRDRVLEEGITGLVIIGLSLSCPILNDYLTDYGRRSMELECRSIYNTGVAFGLKENNYE